MCKDDIREGRTCVVAGHEIVPSCPDQRPRATPDRERGVSAVRTPRLWSIKVTGLMGDVEVIAGRAMDCLRNRGCGRILDRLKASAAATVVRPIGYPRNGGLVTAAAPSRLCALK
jgi:hypothetical protein